MIWKGLLLIWHKFSIWIYRCINGLIFKRRCFLQNIKWILLQRNREPTLLLPVFHWATSIASKLFSIIQEVTQNVTFMPRVPESAKEQVIRWTDKFLNHSIPNKVFSFWVCSLLKHPTHISPKIFTPCVLEAYTPQFITTRCMVAYLLSFQHFSLICLAWWLSFAWLLGFESLLGVSVLSFGFCSCLVTNSTPSIFEVRA